MENNKLKGKNLILMDKQVPCNKCGTVMEFWPWKSQLHYAISQLHFYMQQFKSADSGYAKKKYAKLVDDYKGDIKVIIENNGVRHSEEYIKYLDLYHDEYIDIIDNWLD